MRILVWSPFVNLGGGVRLLSSLIQALAHHPEIDDLTVALPPAFVEAFASAERKFHLLALDEPFVLRWMQSPNDDGDSPVSRFGKRLASRLLPEYGNAVEQRYLARYASGYDLVYVFWPHGRPFQPIGRPVVCTYQDTTFIDFPEILGGAASEREREYARSWVTQVDQLVVSSQTVRARLTSLFGEPGARASVIYHNILTMPARSAPTPDPLPQLPERYLLYPANVNAHKNHDTLLIAWSRFAGREAMPLVLVGESTHILRPDWELRRNAYWLHDHLVGVLRRSELRYGRDYYALGYVPDQQMEQIMCGASGVIMPSLAEGGGSYPAEEALSYGVPLLCSDIPVMREHLSAHSAEIVWFDPLSSDSILSGLETFRSAYPHYHASAQHGMSDARPTWEEIADQYVQVFKRAREKS